MSKAAAFIVGLVMAFCASSALAAPALSVKSASGASGSTVYVSVAADLDQPVNSMQFALKFDPRLLAVQDVKTGSANGSWILVNNPKKQGQVIVGMFNIRGPAGVVSGKGREIAVIKFLVKTPPGPSMRHCPMTLSTVIFDTVRVTDLAAGTFTLTPLSNQ